jgi:predicted nuclease with TOPRIM domain
MVEKREEEMVETLRLINDIFHRSKDEIAKLCDNARLIDDMIHRLEDEIDELHDNANETNNKFERTRPGEFPKIHKEILIDTLYIVKRIELGIEELIKLLSSDKD